MKRFHMILALLLCLLSVSSLAQTLDYWREDHNSSNVWISVDLAPGETKTFTITNTSGIAENPDGIFTFWDDFNDNSLDAAKWTTVESLAGGACSFGEVLNTELDLQAIVNANCRVYADANFSLGYAIESRVFIDSNPSGAPDETYFGWSDATEFGATPGTGQAIFDRTEGTFEFRLHDGTLNNNTAATITNGAYALKTIVRLTNESYWLEDRDPTDRGPNTFDSTYGLFQNDMKISFGSNDASGSPTTPPTIKSDWIFIRPAVYNEPDVSISGTTELTVEITNNDASTLTNYNVLLEDIFGGNLNIQEEVPPTVEPLCNINGSGGTICGLMTGTGQGLNSIFTNLSTSFVEIIIILGIFGGVIILLSSTNKGLGDGIRNAFKKT